MLYGLKEKEIAQLKSAFVSMPEIEAVYIYGSRAKGNYKKTSDIDLAIRFKLDNNELENKLLNLLDDLSVIHKIDIINEAKLKSGNFRDEYELTKKVFYQNR